MGQAREAAQPYAAIYDYFSSPADNFLRPVSTIEHYWALRASRPEDLLGARMKHKQELDNISVAHEQTRLVSPGTTLSIPQSRPDETSEREVMDRYDRDYAHVKRMVVSSSPLSSSTSSNPLACRTRTVDNRSSHLVHHRYVLLCNLPTYAPKLSIGWPAWYCAPHDPHLVTVYFSRK